MTRHGDRTPVHALPHFLENAVWNCTDSFLDVEESDRLKLRKRYFPGRQALKGNCMLGQLTSRGEGQLRTLGKNFRALYIEKLNLLSHVTLDPSEAVLRSTDVDRTIKSAYHFLTGLYPGLNEVVDLDVIERPRDNAFPNRFFCPYLGASIDSLKQQPNFTDYMHVHLEPLRRKLVLLLFVSPSLSVSKGTRTCGSFQWTCMCSTTRFGRDSAIRFLFLH